MLKFKENTLEHSVTSTTKIICEKSHGIKLLINVFDFQIEVVRSFSSDPNLIALAELFDDKNLTNDKVYN